MAKKIVFIHLFFGVIAFGIYHYHLEGPDLVWNMFLALVALDFSLVSYYTSKKVVRGLGAILWLFSTICQVYQCLEDKLFLSKCSSIGNFLIFLALLA